MLIHRVRTSPDPYEPFLLSQGIKAGDLLFVSGQAGYGEDGKIVAPDFLQQGHQAFANLERVLRAGGSSLAQVVKVTIYVTNMSHFPEVLELRRKYFREPYPADTIVEVNGLYTPEAMIEIDAVAVARAGDLG
jgi:reactive intermediate/imine deaminase